MPVIPSEEMAKDIASATNSNVGDQSGGNAGSGGGGDVKATAEDLVNKGPVKVDGEDPNCFFI